jgi:hypothetical protein
MYNHIVTVISISACTCILTLYTYSTLVHSESRTQVIEPFDIDLMNLRSILANWGSPSPQLA